MIPRFLLTLMCVCVLSGIALADDLPIKVENAWLQALPPVAEATAAYMKIRNLGRGTAETDRRFFSNRDQDPTDDHHQTSSETARK